MVIDGGGDMRTMVIARATTDEIRALAEELAWRKVSAADDEVAWQPEATEARILWRPLDSAWGALVVGGEHAEVALDDIAGVLDLWDDVDAMNAIAAAESPAEVAQWACRLGAFAAGDEVLLGTLDVLRGLLMSDREEFVAAAVEGLSHARWSVLAEPLRQAGIRWPDLAEQCGRALASIRKNPV
jgi:hypothetical protein